MKDENFGKQANNFVCYLYSGLNHKKIELSNNQKEQISKRRCY